MDDQTLKKKFASLKYSRELHGEDKIHFNIKAFLKEDEESAKIADDFVKEKTKFAHIIVKEDDEEQPDMFALDYEAVLEIFPFEEVKQVIDWYDPKDEICYLYIRKGFVTAFPADR